MGAAGAAAAAAAIKAIKASGVLVRVDAADFMAILEKVEEPLVVVARGGVFSKHYRYLTSYKGLAFYTKASDQLALPRRAEVVLARKIWVPNSV